MNLTALAVASICGYVGATSYLYEIHHMYQVKSHQCYEICLANKGAPADLSSMDSNTLLAKFGEKDFTRLHAAPRKVPVLKSIGVQYLIEEHVSVPQIVVKSPEGGVSVIDGDNSNEELNCLCQSALYKIGNSETYVAELRQKYRKEFKFAITSDVFEFGDCPKACKKNGMKFSDSGYSQAVQQLPELKYGGRFWVQEVDAEGTYFSIEFNPGPTTYATNPNRDLQCLCSKELSSVPYIEERLVFLTSK